MINKKFISYDEYDRLVNELTLKVKDIDPDLILAIPRGGLAIGLHLSHHLNCPHLYTSKPTGEQCYSLRSKFNDGKLLIVDDVCDSGETIHEITTLFKKYNYTNFAVATIHIKPRRIITPDIYISEVSDDNWLIYPWEYDTDPNKEYMFPE